MGNIKIYTNCMMTEANPYGLGSYMTISGSGCDQLQMYLRTQNRTLEEMFKECRELYGQYFHFTRLDVAIDDKNTEPFFTMEQLKEKCLNREFLSKSRNFRFYESNFQDGSTALTVYIGDRKSKLSYRFYDKDKEQAGKYQRPLSSIGSWKRTEMELRDSVAHGFAMLMANKERGIGQLASDLLGSHLRFIEPDESKR